ncbi:hypothetical protein ABZ260_06690 [Streptosporangium sp. NPDC006013]|uniref:hypothetical protein n=1 Tax=Streptosporangium sp. NPDC006013 TaxID=3155596 RepID=UPI0033B9E054
MCAISLLSASSALGATEVRRYDGEALFQGIFLGQGQVAETYPDLRAPSSTGVWPAARAQQLVAQIKRAEPGFFAAFETAITSGDRIRIEQAASSAGALAAKVPVGDSDPASAPNVAYSFIVVDSTLLKQTNTIWNTNRIWSVVPEGGTVLAQERWVDDVAKTLAR